VKVSIIVNLITVRSVGKRINLPVTYTVTLSNRLRRTVMLMTGLIGLMISLIGHRPYVAAALSRATNCSAHWNAVLGVIKLLVIKLLI